MTDPLIELRHDMSDDQARLLDLLFDIEDGMWCNVADLLAISALLDAGLIAQERDGFVAAPEGQRLLVEALRDRCDTAAEMAWLSECVVGAVRDGTGCPALTWCGQRVEWESIISTSQSMVGDRLTVLPGSFAWTVPPDCDGFPWDDLVLLCGPLLTAVT